ncbi:LuxR family transcriptional regulator [Legionella brunensis]|uniref:Shikimate kinase n=1 Tax=Legionella brunensis TaxID=29422 RepID=A0A0W0S5C5_9GAMM|nr:LuxR family transcriptional regulator [Legionella brunensis]KTC78165.1 shikimate kinase [Legionella brunensis]
MNQTKCILIVGQPGAGKSLLAKTLADKLGWTFIDADFGLEFKIGLEINSILGKQGSLLFQNCQRDILSTLLSRENIVVTTDGSIVDSEINRQLLSSEFVCFLDVSLQTQLDRITRNSLPLMQKNSVGDFLENLHTARDHLYQEISSITINSDDSALEKHVESLIEYLAKNNPISTEISYLQLNNEHKILFHKTSHKPIQLTSQQAICLKLLSNGKSAKEIARDLNISFRTVEAHVAKIMRISGCSNSKELISLYLS